MGGRRYNEEVWTVGDVGVGGGGGGGGGREGWVGASVIVVSVIIFGDANDGGVWRKKRVLAPQLPQAPRGDFVLLRVNNKSGQERN